MPAWGTLGLQRMGLPVVTTIHHPITRDLDIALAAADTFGLRLLIKRWHSFLRMQKQVIRQLANKVTVSHAARADIESAFGLLQPITARDSQRHRSRPFQAGLPRG